MTVIIKSNGNVEMKAGSRSEVFAHAKANYPSSRPLSYVRKNGIHTLTVV